jgi:hypothetical protein
LLLVQMQSRRYCVHGFQSLKSRPEPMHVVSAAGQLPNQNHPRWSLSRRVQGSLVGMPITQHLACTSAATRTMCRLQ